MEVKVLLEAGYEQAMLGLSLSYNQPVERMTAVAARLADKDDGHNKFLEQVAVWLDITAPRYWWQQMDTYRIGVSKQSESTMHTLLKKPLQQESFEGEISPETLDRLNQLVAHQDLVRLKGELPEAFLQRRVVCLNYKVIRHIVKQRRRHLLPEWHKFCAEMHSQLAHAEFISDLLLEQ